MMTDKQLTEHQIGERPEEEKAKERLLRARRAVEAMARIQHAIENCYNDTRTAVDLDARGHSTYNVLSRVERTLADVLTLIELNASMIVR